MLQAPISPAVAPSISHQGWAGTAPAEADPMTKRRRLGEAAPTPFLPRAPAPAMTLPGLAALPPSGPNLLALERAKCAELQEALTREKAISNELRCSFPQMSNPEAAALSNVHASSVPGDRWPGLKPHKNRTRVCSTHTVPPFNLMELQRRPQN